MIRFENVSFENGGQKRLDGVSFVLGKGDFTALVGANGAGKTTLSKLCVGLLKPTFGTVRIGGFDTKTTKTSRIAKFTGFLFQNPDRQICQSTVRAEIRFGLRCVMEDREEAERRAEAALVRFGFDGDKNPFALSRGERQRLVLASLLAVEPEILILDEPTTGLDYGECTQVMEEIRAANERGTTVLMVTHDMEIALDYARRALVLNGGQLLADAPVRQVMRNEALLAEASLLPAQIPALAARLGTGFENAFTPDEIRSAVEALKGRSC